MSEHYYCKCVVLVCSAGLIEVYYIIYLGIVEPTCKPNPWELETKRTRDKVEQKFKVKPDYILLQTSKLKWNVNSTF